MKIKRAASIFIFTCCSFIVLLTIYGNVYKPLPTEIDTDIFVYGSSLGAASAAITASENGSRVLLVSDSNHIGGQAVTAGLGAFDDYGSQWQYYGLYGDLKNFLLAKYPSPPFGGTVGLGNAIVGKIATLSPDIEEFFLKRIKKINKLTVLREYEIVSIQGGGGNYFSAIIENKKGNKNRITIRFRYIADGTETGKLYPLAGAAYDFGFDAQEQTHEPSAMPEAFRDFFVNGNKDQGGDLEGVGNVGQSATLTFPVYDKGFAGDFVAPVSPSKSCWPSEKKDTYIKNSTRMSAKNASCELEFKLKPDFADVYDVYFINHNQQRTLLEAKIGLSGIPEPLYLSQEAFPAEKSVKIGSFFAGPNDPVSVSLSSDKTGWFAEGLILKKRNIQVRQANMHGPISNEGKAFLLSGLPYMSADIYVHSGSNEESISVLLNDKELLLHKAGSGTFVFSDAFVTNGSNVLIANSSISSVTVIPTGESFPDVQVFRNDSDPDSPSNILESSFTVQNDQLYLLTSKGVDGNAFSIEIFDADGSDVLSEEIPDSSVRSAVGVPIAVVALSLDVDYSLRVTGSGAVEIALVPLSQSNILYGKGTLASVKNANHAGIYDIWIRGQNENNLPLSSQGYGSGTLAVPPNAAKRFAYAGKRFMDKSQLFSGSDDQEILAIPNLEVDVFVADVSTDFIGTSTLPTGKYHAIFYPRSESAQKTITVPIDKNAMPLVFHERNRGFESVGSFLANTNAKGLRFGKDTGRLYLFEDFPITQQADIFHDFFSRAPLILISSASDKDRLTLFNFRNIVSPENMKIVETPLLPYQVSNDSMGVANVNYFATDIGPLTEDMLDSPSLKSDADIWAYDMYYWIRHEAPFDSTLFHCSPLEQPLCDPLRIQFAADIFDTSDGLPEKVYIREGRRRKTIKPIVEQDFAQSVIDCRVSECTPEICDQNYIPGHLKCRKAEQNPKLPLDAVAAVHYQFDFHLFHSIDGFVQEYFQYGRENGFIEKYFPAFFFERPITSPTAITLGSLIPDDGGNLFPASTNFGVSQIANSALRTHPVEIEVGASVGYLLAYSLHSSVTPKSIYADPLERLKYQKYLIQKGINIYPILFPKKYDELFRRAVQFLLAEKKISPVISISGKASLGYFIRPEDPFSDEDDSLSLELFGKYADDVAYIDVANALAPVFTRKIQDDSGALKLLQELSLIDQTTVADPSSLLHTKINKVTLYKAFYLKNTSQEDLDK